MCYLCETTDEGGPVSLKDWRNWFSFWFRRGVVSETDAHEAEHANDAGSGSTRGGVFVHGLSLAG
jgi:hypothetical protein